MNLWENFFGALSALLKNQYFTISLRFQETWYRKETKMPEEPQKFAYFRNSEVVGLDEEFVRKADLARKFAGIPFINTSGLRTLEENQRTPGAAQNSAHLTGHAMDLLVGNSHEVYLIIAACLTVGITRFGIYVDAEGNPTHVHIDDAKDDLHVQEVIWIKREGQPNSAPATA